MSSSVNPISPNTASDGEIKNIKFLSLQISHIFNVFCEKSSEVVQITEVAKELLGLRKETCEKTKTALSKSKYGFFIDKGYWEVFALSLGKLPKNPIEDPLVSLNGILVRSIEKNLSELKKAPGYDAKEGFRVPQNWGESETTTLNQIYKEQFFAWVLGDSELPFSSILVMPQVLKSFDDPSIKLDDQIWGKFLPTAKGQERLKEFKSKHNFLVENKSLRSFPIELRKITVIPNMHRTVYNYYKCFENSFEWLVDLLIAGTQPSNQARLKKEGWGTYTQALKDGQKIKDKLKSILKETSSEKVLAYKLRKMFPLLQSYFEGSMKLADRGKIGEEELEAKQAAIDAILMICNEKEAQISGQGQSAKSAITAGKRKVQRKREFSIQTVMKNLLKKYRGLMEQGTPKLEISTQFNLELHSILQEKMTSLKHIQETKAYFILERSKVNFQQKPNPEITLLEKEYPYICSLLSYMETSLAKEQDRWKKKRLSLPVNQFDEMLEKELFSEREETPVKSVKNQHPSTDFSEESEEEEPISDDLSKEIPNLPHVLKDEKMQSYLGDKIEDKQLNGCLSQTIEEGLLQQIRARLSGEQGKEVYDHLLLGAAALEQMAQARYENRIEHVVLGFRSILIHCHFAVEQILSQKGGGAIDSHNLSFLARELGKKNISFSEKEQKFLEEIRVHLWFHYPEDYRFYFGKEKCPKALSLLNALFCSPNTESVQKAMEFSFEKYCQTLEFVVKLTEVSQQSTVDIFRKNINELQEQLSLRLSQPKKNSIAQASLVGKIDKALEILHSLNQLIHLRDLDEGGVLANFDTIKNYLQLMKISLEIPQEASKHSLQKFIQIETLLNVERLFKSLFRAISYFYLERDTRMHNLNKSYSIIEGFYRDPLSEEDRNLLKSINLNITHHYLHRESLASLKKNYDRFLRSARVLSSVDEGFSVAMSEKQIVSHENLKKKENEIMDVIRRSLDLFIRLLRPVETEMKNVNNDIEEDLKEFRKLETVF